jgi:hypothetical protein
MLGTEEPILKALGRKTHIRVKKTDIWIKPAPQTTASDVRFARLVSRNLDALPFPYIVHFRPDCSKKASTHFRCSPLNLQQVVLPCLSFSTVCGMSPSES